MTATTVLTVEDNPLVRLDLRALLEGAGYTVCGGARDGLEAVELARSTEPDVILLDLGLPRMDGVEAARLILEERPVPIVALTGRSEAFAERAVAAGATAWVRKPFSEAELLEVIRRAVGTRAAVAADPGPAPAADGAARLLELLGYPAEWAPHLGTRWRTTSMRTTDPDGDA